MDIGHGISAVQTRPANKECQTIAIPRSASLRQLAATAAIAPHLRGARDFNGFRARIQRLLDGLGISHFGHQCISRPAEGLDIFGTYPEKFLLEYARRQFHLDDLLLLTARAASGQMQPLFQTQITSHLSVSPFVSTQVQANLDLAKVMDKHGIHETCGLYLHDENPQNRALLRISSCDLPADEFQSMVKTHLPSLLALGQAIDQVGRSKFKAQFHNPKLNPQIRIPARPLELLSFLMKDLTLSEAAEILQISISTANQHIALAKKAFNTSTIHGALLCAIREGLLEL